MKRNIGALAVLSMLAACGGGSDAPEATAAAASTTAGKATSTSPHMLRGYYSFDGGPSQQVTFEDRDGRAVLEGDIVLGRTDDIVKPPVIDDRKHAEGIYRTTAGRWNNGIVVYAQLGAPGTVIYDEVTKAMHHFELHTRLRFSRSVVYTNTNHPNPNTTTYDELVFSTTTDPNVGGESQVGRVGGPQTLLYNTAVEGDTFDGAYVMTHEMLHAIGAWHEQSRGDRDSYITVLPTNIIPAYASNFDKHITDGATFGAYDYCSIMHYGNTAFSANGGETMHQLQPFSCQVAAAWDESAYTIQAIGQRTGLSPGDVAMVEGLYASAPAGRPIVDAGPDQTIQMRTDVTQYGSFSATLDGSATHAVPGATIVKYSWKPTGWTANSCANPPCAANPLASYTGPIAHASGGLVPGQHTGTFQYDLTATDNLGRTLTDTVTVFVNR